MGAELEGRSHQGVPPCLRVQGKEGGAEERARHEGGQVLCQVRVDAPGGQSTARHVVRRRQVLHHDEEQLRVEVVDLRHVLRAQPGLLPQRVCLKTRPLLQSSPILSDILYAPCGSLVLPPARHQEGAGFSSPIRRLLLKGNMHCQSSGCSL